jgi:hypothetical protein
MDAIHDYWIVTGLNGGWPGSICGGYKRLFLRAQFRIWRPEKI